ncbi:MAG: hypothetical protein LBP89_08425 [Helicobacteraceae bacterium]|jgi:tetratricopeptide (TPR) repeat protein|nr:hypothetical protein [Helicobacteraceae bacterium]
MRLLALVSFAFSGLCESGLEVEFERIKNAMSRREPVMKEIGRFLRADKIKEAIALAEKTAKADANDYLAPALASSLYRYVGDEKKAKEYSSVALKRAPTLSEKTVVIIFSHFNIVADDRDNREGLKALAEVLKPIADRGDKEAQLLLGAFLTDHNLEPENADYPIYESQSLWLLAQSSLQGCGAASLALAEKFRYSPFDAVSKELNERRSGIIYDRLSDKYDLFLNGDKTGRFTIRVKGDEGEPVFMADLSDKELAKIKTAFADASELERFYLDIDMPIKRSYEKYIMLAAL